VKRNRTLGCPELLHAFGLVRRKVIQDDVDFASPFGGGYDVLQKIDKLGADVPKTRFSQPFRSLRREPHNGRAFRAGSIRTRAAPPAPVTTATPDRDGPVAGM
jgi:hypothetical protein